MKRITLIALATLCVLGAALAQSNDQDVTKVIPIKESSKFKVLYYSPEKKTSRVKIYDAKNNLIQHDKITGGSFWKTYDFSDLEFGKYTLKVETADQTFTHSLDHQLNQKQLSVAVNKLAASKIELFVKGVDDAVSVSLIDDEGNNLFSDVIFVEEDFKRIYDISQLGQKNLTLTVEKNGQKITKRI